MTLLVTVMVVSVGDTSSNKRQSSLGYMVIRDPFSTANLCSEGQWKFPTNCGVSQLEMITHLAELFIYDLVQKVFQQISFFLQS